MKKPHLVNAAIAAVIAIASLSCRDSAPSGVTAPAATPEASLIGQIVQATGLLSCRPQPYDSVTDTVGPEGGAIRVGANTFVVPPGALLTPVAITAVAPSTDVNVVEFQPQGLRFALPATLTMSYANCGLLGGLLPHHIAYIDGRLHILELLPALDDIFARTATARIKHFSGYAIAY
jgi:hypothetical protein